MMHPDEIASLWKENEFEIVPCNNRAADIGGTHSFCRRRLGFSFLEEL